MTRIKVNGIEVGSFRGSRSSSDRIQVRPRENRIPDPRDDSSFHRETKGRAASRRSPRTDRPSRKRETQEKAITRVGVRSRVDRTTTPFHKNPRVLPPFPFLGSFDSWHDAHVVSSARPFTVAVKVNR